MSTLRVGSLFSGIGGIELGLERAGMRVVWQVENDPYAVEVLQKHWPKVRRYGDVRTFNGKEAEPIDVLCGGFPCQDTSQANGYWSQEGLDGARSGLWSEFARIIGETRPIFVLIENVPALLRNGFGRVLHDLHARGYDAEWQTVSAAAVGAPHLRERLFTVAYARRYGLQGLPAIKVRRFSAFQDWSRLGCAAEITRGPDPRTPTLYRKDDGVSAALGGDRIGDQLRCIGNAVVPQVAQLFGESIVSAYKQIKKGSR